MSYATLDIEAQATHDVDVDKHDPTWDVNKQKQIQHETSYETNKPTRRCSSRRSRWTLCGGMTCLIITLPFLILGLIAYNDIKNMNTSMVIQTLNVVIDHDVGIHTNMHLTNVPHSVKWMPVTLSQVTCAMDIIWDNITHPLATATLQQGSINIVSDVQQVTLEIHQIKPETITHTLFRLFTGDPIRTIAHCSSHIQGKPFGLFSISSNYAVSLDVTFTKNDISSRQMNPLYLNETITPWYQYIELMSGTQNWMQQSLVAHFPFRVPENDVFKDAIIKVQFPETNYATTVYEPHYLTLSIPSFELDLSPKRHGDALIPFTMSIKGTPDCFHDGAINSDNTTTWRIVSCDAHLITEIVGEQHTLVFSKQDQGSSHTYTVALDQINSMSNNLIHGTGTGSYTIVDKPAAHVLSVHTQAVSSTLTTISTYATAIVHAGDTVITLTVPTLNIVAGGSRGYFHVDGNVSMSYSNPTTIFSNVFNTSFATTWDFDSTPQHASWQIVEWGGYSKPLQPGPNRFVVYGDATVGHIGSTWDASLNDFYIQTTSTTITNVSAHAQLDTSANIMGFSFWEGKSLISIPIPLPLGSYVPPPSWYGVRKYGLASLRWDTSHGLLLHTSTALGVDGKLVSQSIAEFAVDTNAQTLNWQLLETDNNMVLTSTTALSSTRLASLAHITALSWSSSILDLSLDTFSVIVNSNVQLNITAHARLDTTNPMKQWSISIMESPTLPRAVPLPLVAVNVQNLDVVPDGSRYQQVITGWVDTSHGFTFAWRQGVSSNSQRRTFATVKFSVDTTQLTINSLFQENQLGPAVLTPLAVNSTRIQHVGQVSWFNTWDGSSSWRETDIQLTSGTLAINQITQVNVAGRFRINKNNYIALSIWEGKVEAIPYTPLPLATQDTTALVNAQNDHSNIMVQGYVGYDTTTGLNVVARLGMVVSGKLITNATITGISNTATGVLSWSLFESNVWSEQINARVAAQAKGTFVTSASPYDVHVDTVSLTVNQQIQANISTWITIDTSTKHITGSVWAKNDTIPAYALWSTAYGDSTIYGAWDFYYNLYRPNTNIIAPAITQGIFTIAVGGNLLTSAALMIGAHVYPNGLTWTLGETSNSTLTYPITWAPMPYRLYTNGQFGIDRDGPYGAHVDFLGLAINGDIKSNVTGMIRIDTTAQTGTVTAYQCACAQVPVVTSITTNNINTFPNSNFATTLTVYGDGSNGFTTWGSVATTINNALKINGTATLYVNTVTERWGGNVWGASDPWVYYEPNHLSATAHGTYHKQSGANVVDFVIEELSLTTPSNGYATVQFNITAHAIFDVDTPAISLALWEKQGIMTIPIPAPFNVAAPMPGQGYDLAFVLLGRIDRTNGARITSQGVIVTSSKIVTNYTVGFVYDTNTYQWSSWAIENPSILVSPPDPSFRTIGLASGSAEFRRGLADFTITKFSMANSGLTRFNFSFHARVDVDNQLAGVALWGVAPRQPDRSVSVTIPLQCNMSTFISQYQSSFTTELARVVYISSSRISLVNGISYNENVVGVTIQIDPPPMNSSYFYQSSAQSVASNIQSQLYYPTSQLITSTSFGSKLMLYQYIPFTLLQPPPNPKPIAVSIPLQFDTYVVNPNDGNQVAFNIWTQVDTTTGVLIQEHATIASSGSLLTNEYGYLWINWVDHFISWLVLEDNIVITFPTTSSVSNPGTSSILTPTYNQRAPLQFSTAMKFSWVPVSPYNIQLAMDAASKSKLLTNVTASAGIDTTLKTLYANLFESNDVPTGKPPRFGATTTGFYNDYSMGPNDNGAGKSAQFNTILTNNGELLVNTTINGRVHQAPTTMGLQLITHDNGIAKEILNINWGGSVSTTTVGGGAGVPPTNPPTIPSTPTPTVPPDATVLVKITLKCNKTTFITKYQANYTTDLARVLKILVSRIHVIDVNEITFTPNRLKWHIMATSSTSVQVTTQIDPPPAGSTDTTSALAAANNLAAQVSNSSSPLLTSTSFGSTIDTTKGVDIIVQQPTQAPSSSSSNTPLIVGVVVGVIGGLLLLMIVGYCCYRRGASNANHEGTDTSKPTPVVLPGHAKQSSSSQPAKVI